MANTDLVKKKPVALEVATYERLSKLAAQLRIDSPGGSFVSMSAAVGVLLDSYAVINQLNAAREKWVKNNPKDTASFVIEPGENGEVQFWRIEEDAYAQSRWTELFAPVSLRAYVADVEVNEQVIIKQSDGSQYLEKMLAHNHNAYLTPQRDEAMIFDNRDQAAAFLRKCGHEVGNWIIESV